MLFDTRTRATRGQRLRQAILPTRGYRRAWRYRLARLGRMHGSPHELACGAALGLAVAFTPWFGLHLILLFVLCRLLRGSFLIGMPIAWISNPWTLPLFFAVDYEVGRLMLGMPHHTLPSIDDLSWTILWQEAWSLLVPVSLGSLPLAVLAFVLTYWPLKRVIAKSQANRRRRIEVRRLAIRGLRPDPASPGTIALTGSP